MGQSGPTDDGRVRVGRPVGSDGRSCFGLTGVSHDFDPRTVAIRPDLADIAVAGRHFAPHYAAPMMRSVSATTELRGSDKADAEVLATMLPGEGFALLDLTGGVAWGYRLSDHLVGYCAAEMLVNPIAPSHRVMIAQAQVRAEPDAAADVQLSLPSGSLVMGIAKDDWLETPQGWLKLADVEEVEGDMGTASAAVD